MASPGYEDMRIIKTLLDMSDKRSNERSQELVLMGAALESLRDIKERLDKIERGMSVENKPKAKKPKPVTKVEIKKPKKERSLIEQLKGLSEQDKESLLNIIRPNRNNHYNETEPQTSTIEHIDQNNDIPVESVADRKRNKIKELVTKHKKLTSSQLSKLIGLSRTRCNEYLKELESDGELTGFTENKKRYYQIR